MGHLISSGLGWLYMWLRYRSKTKREAVLQKDYGGSYSLVAQEGIWMVFTVLLALLFLGFIVLVLISVTRK